MTENPLVSIIVPVYKVEGFLDRCVESLVNQSYENIEIILVDDGSPDNCGVMCDAWAEKDSRIKVIHKENGGLSDARNKGVEIAQGEYISFVDSDDYVSVYYAEYLLNLLRENSADIACGSFRIVHDEPESFENQPEENIVCFDKISACRAYLGDYHMSLVTAWGKLFPVNIVKGNPFPVGRLHEDEACTYKYYYNGTKTVLGTREIYGYYQNSQSITHTKTRKNQEHTLRAMEERCEYFLADGENGLYTYAAEQLILGLVYAAGSGEELARELIREKRMEKYLNMGVGLKYKLFFRVYEYFGINLNEVLKIIKRKK